MLLMSISASAATGTESEQGGSASITVALPAGRTADTIYKVFKVFDATQAGTGEDGMIAYRLMDGKTTVPDVSAQMESGYNASKTPHFILDGGGNIHFGTEKSGKITADESGEMSEAAIKAVAAYVNGDDPVATVTAGKDDTEFTVTGLEYGYYYITTTTGTLVTIDSTNPNAEVEDKNTVPTLDKTILQARADRDSGHSWNSNYGDGIGWISKDSKSIEAEVGTIIDYKANVIVGEGAENYTFHDRMSDGLEFIDGMRICVWKVNPNGFEAYDTSDNTLSEICTYTKTEDKHGFDLAFKNEFIQSISAGSRLEIMYAAKITNAALTVNPEKNTATLDFGDENHLQTTPPSETKAYSAKFTVTKTDGDGNPLGGAGFILKHQKFWWMPGLIGAPAKPGVLKAQNPNAGGSRIYLSDMGFSTDEEIEALEKEMGVTFPTYYYKWDEENQRVTWTTDINEATEVFTTKENNSVVFKGLTDGKYTIIEKTVPDGYNKAEDYNFTIEKNNYSADNLEQSATVTNQAGSALPNTGGPGTRLFTILGSILILGAGVLLWRRRRLI